jgi:hypothetical protein
MNVGAGRQQPALANFAHSEFMDPGFRRDDGIVPPQG